MLKKSLAGLSPDSAEAPENPIHAKNLAHAKIGLRVYHTRQENYGQAESLLTDAHETFARFYEAGPGVEAPLTPVRQVRSRLVQLYEAWGKPSKAQQYASAGAEATSRE